MKSRRWPSPEPEPYYSGPVRWVEPTYGNGYADMFCPECGSTELDSLERYGRKLRCRRCGRVFNLELYPDNDGKEFSINYGGDPKYERLPADEVGYYAFGTIVDEEDYGRMSELAAHYYGDAYTDLYDDDSDLSDMEVGGRLVYDVPSVEVNHIVRKGYVGGMSRGDEIFVPGTDVSIVRTKNFKTRKSKKPAARTKGGWSRE